MSAFSKSGSRLWLRTRSNSLKQRALTDLGFPEIGDSGAKSATAGFGG
jgi:hypothetical protein